jgi:aminoglycoside phosphotransferase (APT) family kinase protein
MHGSSAEDNKIIFERQAPLFIKSGSVYILMNPESSEKSGAKVTEERLLAYVGRLDPDREGLTVSRLEDITSGWETELYRFNLDYDEGGLPVSRRLVLRLYPGSHASGKAKKEFTVMGRLREVGYPVPEVHEVETDVDVLGAPFMIMEWVEGHSMMDDFLGTPSEALGPHLEAFTTLFAELHRIDAAQVFPESPRFKDTSSYLEMVLERTAQDLNKRGLPWLRPILDWLDEHRHKVSPGRFSVLHRDFHPGNVMVRDDDSHAVIDWGASSLGDPREDLMWTVLLASAFWGKPFGKTILEAYQREVGEVRDSGFFEVASIFRRIQDTSISFMRGAEEAGMRAGGLEQMKESLGHLHRVHGFLEERTGIRLPEFDELLRSVEG